MRLSSHARIFRSEVPDQVVLFSARTAAILEIDRAVLEDVEAGSLPEEEQRTLAEQGLLTGDPQAEQREILDYIEELNQINTTFQLIIALNLDCNLACPYCFEGSRKGAHYMSRETADRLVAFVRTEAKDAEHVSVTFYGGEPTLSAEIMSYLARRLNEAAKADGRTFAFGMITNGTLLSRRLVEQLKPLGFKSASVTLDGPEDIHDLSRPFKSGKGSFGAIVRNVKDVCDLIEVQLGGNFTPQNYREFPRLLDFLLEQGLTPERLESLKFDPVAQERAGIASPDFREGCSTLNEPWLYEASVFLREETMRRGFNTSRIMPILCMMDNRRSFVVNYDGGLFKCPGLIGQAEFSVGTISTGISDYRQSHCLDNWKNEECLACQYLPLCFGGCRYSRLVREGNMNGVDCKKPYLDACLEALVKQDLRYA